MRRAVAFASLLIAMAGGLAGHPAGFNSAIARIFADGRYEIDVRFDAPALAINDAPERVSDAGMRALLTGPRREFAARLARAGERLGRNVRIEADGAELPSGKVTRFPEVADVLPAGQAMGDIALPLLAGARIEGRLPAGVARLRFRFPESLGRLVFSFEQPGAEAVTEPLEAGAWSDGETLDRVEAPRPWRTIVRFIGLGFEHIVPNGLDHILFVLGLFLLGGSVRALLWQVSAFTLAHSMTLGLALAGVVRVPAAVVEPVIALSIVLVAVDNLRARTPRGWRVAAVFGFGLFHGLGFAGALMDSTGLGPSEFWPALVGFNLGVEYGQLTVIAAAFLAVGWWRGRENFRRRVTVPGSVAIALTAAVWFVQRVLAAI